MFDYGIKVLTNPSTIWSASCWSLARVEEQLATRGSVSTEELDHSRPSPELEARLREQRLAMIEQVYARLVTRSGGDKIDRKHLTAM